MKSKIQIEKIIGNYVSLQKSGKDYKCQCPFHDDHNPSMYVNAEKQIYKCFVCNAGGDVYDFIMRYNNINFEEAYKLAIELSGLSTDYLKEIKRKKVYDPYSMEQKEIFTLYERVIEYMEYQLCQNINDSLSYLKTRKFSEQAISKYHIGYLDSVDSLVSYLMKKYDYTHDQLLKTDFFGLKENGKFYSKFEKRINIPITDRWGTTVGFGGRIFKEEDTNKAKYINSSESNVFKKSEVLFGFYNALSDIYKTKELYLMEGYVDVILTDDHKLHNCVGLMGKALTLEQINLIRKISDLRVHICTDLDKPGREAALQIAKQLEENHIKFDFSWYESAKDPGELAEHDLTDELTNHIDLFNYKMNHELLINNSLSEEVINELLLILHNEDSPIRRTLSLRALSDKCGIEIEVLKEQYAYVNKIKENITPIMKEERKSSEISDIFKNRRRIPSV